jgi:hypothetical protein
VLKQTYSNYNIGGKKNNEKGGRYPIKNINDHKKNYISPYSIKAIAKQ